MITMQPSSASTGPTINMTCACGSPALTGRAATHSGGRQGPLYQPPDRRIEAIKTAIPLTTDPAVIEPHQLHVMSLIHRLALTLFYLARYDEEIQQRFEALDDAPLFDSLPGAGRHLAPRLLIAFGEDRQRFTSAESLCRFAGIAPVTEHSGRKSWVHWRYSCPRFLRQTFIEWANKSTCFSFRARGFYQL